MANQVCVDASLALMLMLPEEMTLRAKDLWGSWEADGREVVTAPLFFAEVTSVIREHVYFRRISPTEGEEAFQIFLSLPVRSVAPANLQPRAWELAKAHNLRRAYDAQYLAVAAILGCELWTADQRLVNAVRLPWLRWVGEHPGTQQLSAKGRRR